MIICFIIILKLILPDMIAYGLLYYRNNDFNFHYYYGLVIDTDTPDFPYLRLNINILLMGTILPILILILISLIILFVKINKLKRDIKRKLGALSVALLALEPFIQAIMTSISNVSVITIPLSNSFLNFFFAIIVGFGTLKKNNKSQEPLAVDVKNKQKSYFLQYIHIIYIFLLFQLVIPSSISINSDGSYFSSSFFSGIFISSMGLYINPFTIIVMIPMMIATLFLLFKERSKIKEQNKEKLIVLGMISCILLLLYPVIWHVITNWIYPMEISSSSFGNAITIVLSSFYTYFFPALIVGVGTIQYNKRFKNNAKLKEKGVLLNAIKDNSLGMLKTKVKPKEEIKKKVIKEGEMPMDANAKRELEETEREVEIEKKQVMCIVHRGIIHGNIYLCQKCQTFYCDKCAKVLKLKDELCWTCGSDITIAVTELDKKRLLDKEL